MYGAGGHAKVVLDCARACAVNTECAVVDDSAETATFYGCPVVGGRDLIVGSEKWRGAPFIIAVGENITRAKLFHLLVANHFQPLAVIHPAAVLSPTCRVDVGTVVMPRVTINADAIIGQNCIVNTGAIVEHDCVIGDHAHLSPGVILGGGVRVGKLAHLGLGATVLPGLTIGEGAVVGAGAVVLRNVDEGTTVAGVPAKVIIKMLGTWPPGSSGHGR